MKTFSYFIFIFIVANLISCKNSEEKTKKEFKKNEVTKTLPQYSSKAEARFKKLDSIPESSKIFIKMTEDNRVLLNSGEISDSILKIKIKDLIIKNNPNYAILVQSHNKTKYSTYLRIDKICKDSYLEIKNKYSSIKFKTEYEILNDANKHEIDSLFPINIYEFEPTN